MQTRMTLKSRLIRWILRLLLPRHSSVDLSGVKKVLTERFRQFIAKGEDPIGEQLLDAADNTISQGHSHLRVPSAPLQTAPDDLRKVLPVLVRREVVLMQSLAIKGREYWTTESAHGNNSLIMYASEGGTSLLPGQIKYIVYVDGTHYFAVNKVEQVQHKWDFFSPYADYPSAITKSSLGQLDLLTITSESVFSQYAKFPLSKSYDLIVHLSRVSLHISLISHTINPS